MPRARGSPAPSGSSPSASAAPRRPRPAGSSRFRGKRRPRAAPRSRLGPLLTAGGRSRTSCRVLRVLATRMWPPLCSTMPNTVDSPSPVPRPLGFVVKNGSKICASVADVHPRAIVGHDEDDVLSRIRDRMRHRRGLGELHALRVDRESRRRRHRVARIDRQVQQDLLHLSRVDAHGCEVLAERHPDRDILADRAHQHALRVRDEFVEAHDPRFEHLLAAEREQLLRKLRARASPPREWSRRPSARCASRGELVEEEIHRRRASCRGCC